MKLNLNLPAEIESMLRRRAAAAGQDVETFVAHVVTEELTDDVGASTSFKPVHSTEEFMARLEAVIKRHGTRVGHFDDSRESIYDGRGE